MTVLKRRRSITAAILSSALSVAAIAATSLAAAPAHAAVDRTPPTAPYILYSQGFQCFTLYIGVQRSIDNRTPQLSLRYEVFANGASLGTYADNGYNSAAWATMYFRTPGPQPVYVRAIDRAGNKSARSNTNVIRAYGPC
jgi:hypothetical protein